MVRVFLSAADTYVGRALVRKWRPAKGAEASEGGTEVVVVGSTRDGATLPGLHSAVPLGSEDVRDIVASADIVVLNLIDALAEASLVVDALRSLPPASLSLSDEPERARVVVALSSAVVWQKTKPAKDGSDFPESKYKRRKAPAALEDVRVLETHVMALAREGLKVHVVGAGLPYGAGEGPLHRLFRQAWLCEDAAVEIPCVPQSVEDWTNPAPRGRNVLPLIHVDDLASVTKAVAEGGAEQEYLLAVDRGQCSLRQVAAAVARALGGRRVEEMDPEKAQIEFARSAGPLHTDALLFLQANLKFDLSDAAAHTALGVEWKSEGGFVDACPDLVAEYLKTRDLRPLRLVVLGPPGVGKSRLAEQLASHYYLDIVRPSDAIQGLRRAKDDHQRLSVRVLAAGINLPRGATGGAGVDADADGKDGDDGSAGDDAGAAGGDGGAGGSGDDGDGGDGAAGGGGGGGGAEEDVSGMEPADEEGTTLTEQMLALADRVEKAMALRPRLKRRLLAKVVRWWLRQPRRRNRGWVLDGYPRSFKEAEALWKEGADEEADAEDDTTEPTPDDDDDAALAASSGAGGAAAGGDGGGADAEADGEEDPIAVDAALAPHGVVLLEGADAALEARVLSQPTSDEARFRRRLQRWRRFNAASSLHTAPSFFERHAKVEVIERTGAAPAVAADAETLSVLLPYFEKGGAPFNYHPTEEERAAAEAAHRAAAAAAAAERDRADLAARSAEERERAARDHAEKSRLQVIARHEAELLEARTAPLRKYLVDQVLPTLTRGLLEVCAAQPDDPVDYLAEFLFRAAARETEAHARP